MPLLSREIQGEFHVNAILKTLGELLETMVREANSAAFKEYDRRLERQRITISDLKESVGMIQRQLRKTGVNITSQPFIRTSPRDIRNFRKKLGITQEVFAHILHVNIATVIRWEKASTIPHPKHRKIIRELKMMDKNTLQHLIQASKTALYE